ncbi:MAG: hypothetical protein HYU66_04715 [Armatimonadetes bacterium]|nr:hypothetical protein [Armatimonadota bacterium]
MVVLAGWIHRGYDNQHPDILPAAPECGGNEALWAAGKRIKACGYLFGLHDNYQDMYADAPSFDVKHLRRGANGKPLMGGNWAGGQAWQVRPQSQVELAQRNLPEVAGRFGPSIYFIDTVFAWGLVDSQAPGDVWDRGVDLDYKSKLCAYARKVTGAFGSEEGREWAVPVSDYLEGLYGHKFDTPPGEVLPIFEIAYHDCVSTYTHQSTRIGPDDAKHVLDHVIYGEMPLYNFGSHLYWQGAEAEAVPLRVSAAVKGAGPRTFEVTYTWDALGKVAADYSAFVHFTHPRSERPEQIAMQNDHALPATSTWQAGSRHTDGPHAITVPEGYSGDFELRLGLLNRDGERQALSMGRSDGGRYLLGIVHAGPDGVTFTPAEPRGVNRPFARKEGWSRDLCTTDRFIKNTYEVLSWVHRLTFGVPLEEHHVEGPVERTRFGADLRVVCNYGAEPVTLEAGPVLGRVTLPQDGFAVWSPTFVAVHATEAGGKSYATPALYTARGLDGEPLGQSAQVRVYHGCGGPALGLAGKTFSVEREAEVRLR